MSNIASPNGRHIILAERVKTLACKQSFVIDCACGKGQVMSLLSTTQHKVIGFDIDLARINTCSAGGLNVQEASICQLPLANDVVDVFICSETLEHLNEKDFYLALNEIHRVLQPSGLIIITVPEQEKDILKDPKHLKHVKFNELHKFFNTYEVIEQSVVFKSQKCRDKNSGSLLIIFKK